MQYIQNYNSIKDAITNYFHHEAFGTTGDVSVPDLFNTAIDETVTSTANDAESNIWNDDSGVGSLIGQGGFSSNEGDEVRVDQQGAIEATDSTVNAQEIIEVLSDDGCTNKKPAAWSTNKKLVDGEIIEVLSDDGIEHREENKPKST